MMLEFLEMGDSKIGTDEGLSRDLAANLGIPFKTPEEHFLDENPRRFVRAFDPTEYLADGANDSTESGALTRTCVV